MRIDRLEIENFKKYAKQGFDFHPKFTLLVGDNGSGKTTILDALAVAAGVWLTHPPDAMLYNSGRIIYPTEIHLEPEGRGDRIVFNPQLPPRSRRSAASAKMKSRLGLARFARRKAHQ